MTKGTIHDTGENVNLWVTFMAAGKSRFLFTPPLTSLYRAAPLVVQGGMPGAR